MNHREYHRSWQPLLDIADRLSQLQKELERAEDPFGAEKLRASLDEPLELLRQRIREQDFGSVLASFFPGSSFTFDEIAVLVLLAQRYLAGPSRWMRGREILAHLFPSSAARLQGAPLLLPPSPLVESGALLAEAGENAAGEDPLESRYRLSDVFLAAIFAPPPDSAQEPPPPPRPPLSDIQLLSRLKEILDLCIARAQKIFEREGQPAPAEIAENQALDEKLERIQHSLRAQVEGSRPPFPSRLLSFRREHALSWEEFLATAFLLISEVYQGESFIPAAHLLKLFCRRESEIWHKLWILSPSHALIRRGILMREEMIEGRILSAEIALSSWVVEELATGFKRDESIAPDERIDFHLYLRKLGDSASFLHDLDPEPAAEANACEDRGSNSEERNPRAEEREVDPAEPPPQGHGGHTAS